MLWWGNHGSSVHDGASVEDLFILWKTREQRKEEEAAAGAILRGLHLEAYFHKLDVPSSR